LRDTIYRLEAPGSKRIDAGPRPAWVSQHDLAFARVTYADINVARLPGMRDNLTLGHPECDTAGCNTLLGGRHGYRRSKITGNGADGDVGLRRLRNATAARRVDFVLRLHRTAGHDVGRYCT
jgi:hypothetical protein